MYGVTDPRRWEKLRKAKRGSSFVPIAGLPASRNVLGAITAKLERAEILVPQAFGHVGFGFQPEAQPVQVV
jgi:hypothetical protein